MIQRQQSCSSNAHSTYAGWGMAWIALAIASVGLLTFLGLPFAPTSLVALFVGSPVTLYFITALEFSLTQAIAATLALAALYGFLALRMMQRSGFALSCGLGLVLIDIAWGVLGVFGASGAVSPVLVIALTMAFFLPRLSLIYLISQGLNASDKTKAAQTLGAFARNVVMFLLAPVQWILHKLAEPAQPPGNHTTPTRQQRSARK
ncbi:hypothetical protein [Vacuolonema iberomarrocanum]|uniref:hypothetical protein n=1 Tax=Vacuolonema iberomarrocanum TaxID=3454632 RepID=UPI0019EE574B|nr:hypothetical protein [filamentous cyanobacterium LEGE 07170]